jgi:hypothetical protein
MNQCSGISQQIALPSNFFFGQKQPRLMAQLTVQTLKRIQTIQAHIAVCFLQFKACNSIKIEIQARLLSSNRTKLTRGFKNQKIKKSKKVGADSRLTASLTTSLHVLSRPANL